MPSYLFIHPDTEEVREEVQKMTEPHVYIDEKGIEWRRLWSLPRVSIDTVSDPFSSKEFVEKTRNKNLSVGDLWDMSADMAIKRESQAGGRDAIKEGHDAKETKKRKGKRLSPANVRNRKS